MKNYSKLASHTLWLWTIALCFMFPSSSFAQTTYQLDKRLEASIEWYIGANGKVDDNKAKELLDTAASTGDPLAVMWLARVYSTGRMGYPADKSKAKNIAQGVIHQVEALAKQNVPEAVFLMGTAYAEGIGKNNNSQEAVKWYRQAAELGHTLAQHNLGNAYAFAQGIEQNHELAVTWWRKAAEQGDAIPQYQLGLSYEKGNGVKKDLTKAEYWFKQSADRGYAKASVALTRLNRLKRLNR